MKALILNSGLGSRMGVLTSEHPKCMTEISANETILSRQLRQIADAGIEEVVMTTGLFDGVLVNYCQSLNLPPYPPNGYLRPISCMFVTTALLMVSSSSSYVSISALATASVI